MLDETLPVLSIMMKGKVYDKILSNSEEAKARNAKMIALTNSSEEKLKDLFDDIIKIPETDGNRPTKKTERTIRIAV